MIGVFLLFQPLRKSLLSGLSGSPESAVSDDGVGADQTLLPCLPLPEVHVEILPEKEGVRHLHLAVGRQAGTLVDEVIILLVVINVDQTLLSDRSTAGQRNV